MKIKIYVCARYIAFGTKTQDAWNSPQIASEQLVMNLSMKDRVLLVKLFYKNDDSSFKEIPVINGPMSVDVQKIIKKLEETGSFTVKSGRGMKSVVSTSMEDVASAL
ncbi:hypothetical protein CEXT_676381 [Caerostris extrusa]|uniref:Uncharacterized protein n=1 Tax=Caerostris extrusa TaxID=172846 RepID=A0AAV4X3K6_CAEEX|nr:hypothetical protein CEXT_676381 [Caerostris extrusa]